MKTRKLADDRDRRQSSKLSFNRKFFPNTNLTPGGTYKLQGRDKHTHLRTDKNGQPPKTSTLNKTPKRRIFFNDTNIFSPSKRTKFSENLNFWLQNEESESGDLVGPSSQTILGQKGDNGSGGNLNMLEQYKKKVEGPQ